VDWLTTVLAEDAPGSPAALRRTPLQAATRTVMKLANLPMSWSTRGFDRALEALRGVRPAFDDVIRRGAHADVVAVKALAASRHDALASAERVTRQEGGQIATNRLRSTGEYSITISPFVVSGGFDDRAQT
jgi:hypothetical protein